jgi:genome maintenance exonuclease 1
MLITKPFDYQPLKRVESPNGRRYIVGESRPLPSVTTILSKTKDMTHLKEWRERVGEDEANKITSQSTGIGNGMHKNLENYILGQPITGTFYAQTLAKVIIKQAFPKIDEIWGSEVSLYSKDLYAGTTDLVGIHEGIPSIMDFKNSLKEKKKEWIEDYFMQLAAYSLAHNEMFGTNIQRGVVMIATRDAKYQEFIIEGDEFTHYETMWANKVCAYYDRFGRD